MTLDQLRAFANSDEQHLTKLALTKEAARALIREHDLEVNANADLFLFEPKDRPDEGKYAAHQFARIASANADAERIAAERGGA
jgi:hypothetical protein